jgi:hypothetical protein
VIAGAGVGARGRSGGGQGADRGVEQLGDLVDPGGQLAELAQQQPGQPGVMPGDQRLDHRPTGGSNARPTP